MLLGPSRRTINRFAIREKPSSELEELTITGKQQSAADIESQDALRQNGQIPRHIAIIMDGNGRWARERGQDRVIGHHEGVRSVRDVTEACAQLGVEQLTLYTFSTENWNRPPHEVDALMQLLIHTIRSETSTLRKNDIRLTTIGDVSSLPDACRDELFDAINSTRTNSRMTLSLAISYSGRSEIIRAVRRLAERVAKGDISPSEIDERLFSETLDTVGVPDPDLLIRTGGEYRVSNFLLWQIAYTEMYITEDFWPSFRRNQLYDAIRDYQNRDRRFGRVSS